MRQCTISSVLTVGAAVVLWMAATGARGAVLPPEFESYGENNGYNGEQADAATCTVADCTQCAPSDAKTCALCQAGVYLLDGACVLSCPAPFTPLDTGLNGRVCQPALPPTTQTTQMTTRTILTPRTMLTTRFTEAPCTVQHCSLRACVGNTCTECQASRYLHNGACVDSCPAPYTPLGTGLYGRECQAPDPCDAVTDCHLCTVDEVTAEGSCTVCKAGKYLYDGECLAACPSGFTPVGTGTFGRECLVACTNILNCIACAATNTSQTTAVCVVCGSSQYLHAGGCVSSCPHSLVAVGTGEFGRECVEDTGSACSTVPGCAVCAQSIKPSCAVCGDYLYLLNGQCVASCPANLYTPVEPEPGPLGRSCGPLTVMQGDAIVEAPASANPWLQPAAVEDDPRNGAETAAASFDNVWEEPVDA
eukprot:m.203043 g.203043  ORF g.203043 m.203043 type:complete len:420 (+) comp21970_c0_seq2:1713-2972(+)